jgi:hypothetical protein
MSRSGQQATGLPHSLSPEAEETLNAIRAGQVDALVIRRDDTTSFYALRSFVEIARTRKAQDCRRARRRSQAQPRCSPKNESA